MNNKTISLKRIVFNLFLALLLSSSLSLAEERSSAKNNKDRANPKDDNSVQLTAIQGIAQIQRVNDTAWIQADTGSKLYSQDKIRTLIDSLATLQYPDSTQLTLRENSMLTIQDISKDSKTGLTKRELKLNVGGMKYKVTKLTEKGSEFKIHTSTAIVGVTGTEGNIENSGEGKPTKNTLIEGATYNTDEQGKNGRPLNAGNSWEIDEKAHSEKHMATQEETNNNLYKGKDPAAEKRFEDFMKNFNQKKDQGYDMLPLAKLFEQILEAMSKNDSLKLTPLLDEAEKLFPALKKSNEPKAKEINNSIQSILQEIEAKKKDGYDLSLVHSLLAQAQSAYQEEKYARAEELLEQIKHSFTTLEKKLDDFKPRLEAFETALNNKAKDGFIVTELIEIAKQIKMYSETGSPSQAEQLLNKAGEMLAAAKRQIPAESLKAVEDIKTEIAAKKKDGFDVAELKTLILLADKAIEENDYLKLEETLMQIKDKLKIGLTKTIPEDTLLLFNNFQDLLKKKQEAGFDLLPIQNLIKSVYDTKEEGDFAALRTTLIQAQDALLKLSAPGQLLKHFQELKDELKEKKDAGYEVKQIEDQVIQAQVMLDKGVISDIPGLFTQIDTALNTLKDLQPPLLQVGDLTWTNDDKNITLSGIAKDNIEVSWVSVNGGIVNLDANGNFQQNLIFTPLLKEIVVEAKDSSGNPAPVIKIPLPQEKINSLAKADDSTPPELKPENIQLNHILPDALEIKGKAEANTLITVNGKEILTDSQGAFSTQIKASKELIEQGLSITSRDAGGNSSPELKIPVPDKWPPIIHSAQPILSDQIPPGLKVNDLIYEGDKIKVSGVCQDVANIIVKVEAEDIGSEIKEYTFNAAKSQSSQDTLMLTPDLKSVDIAIADKEDNLAKTNAAIDFFVKPAVVTVNGKEIPLDKDGVFSTEIPAQPDLHQIVVAAKDSTGNETTPVTMAIADIIPPALILGDPVYSKDSVEINGKTEPYAKVKDKSGKLFDEEISADNNGVFKIKVNRPEQPIAAMLTTEDSSGNRSDEVNVPIEPLVDKNPPQLTVSNLEYKGNKIIVSGSCEDDSGIKSVTVNGQPVELRNNLFSVEQEITPELTKIEILSTDLSEKTASVLKVVADDSKPEISVEDLSYDNGYCLVKGKISDNIGLKEVRVNNIPVPLDVPGADNFEYRLPITVGTKEITATAIDLYGNFSETPAQTITLPEDNIPPTLTLNELAYGSPIVIVSGMVKDNVGIKQVLVNGAPVNLYEDGSFKTQIPIKFSSPTLTLNDPIYDKGIVTISGRLNPGAQEPREIIAQAEDLSGNKSETLRKEPQPFQLEEIKVMVNGQLVELQNGSFSSRLQIEKGTQEIKIIATDPFGNSSDEVSLPLEKTPPIIELNEPRYLENNVTLSGTAKDNASGIAEVLINAVSVPVGEDGKFSQTFTVSESSVTVVAIDRLGNLATAPPIKLTPADKAGPLFILKVTPMPATIGKSVFITIDVLDSKTRLPEILPNPPEVKLTLPNSQNLDLKINGQGASFNASFDTTGLTPGTVNISIKGTDAKGNIGDKIEGTSLFLLNTQDNVPPTVKITVSPPTPVFAGTDVQIMLTISETLKNLPKTEISLPGGTKFNLTLEGSLSGTLFSKNVNLPQDLPPGEAVVTASGAVDLAGNTQTANEEFRFFVRPQSAAIAGGLILRLETPEITPNKVSLKGITAPGAIVHLNAANIQADIPADENGRFNFIRQISPLDIENWSRLYPDGFISLNCFSTNYAGQQSEVLGLKFPLPKITIEAKGALFIEVQPDPVEQGKPINILIKSQDILAQPPRALIKFIDGRSEPLILSGQGKEFSAVYPATMAARPGPAIIEVRTEKSFHARPFMIIPFGPTMMTGGFYNISAKPDPGVIGKEAEFFVQLQRPIDKPPRLQIRLPNGKMDNIALSGQGMEFKGKYLCPANIFPGPAELIINDGEFRRPYGIAPETAFGYDAGRMFSGLVAYSNPSPMLVGSTATITVKSDQRLNFLPKVDLRLTNGRFITIALSGALPGNTFSSPISIPMDAPYGPATIVLKNERNEIIGEHPANIAPAYTAPAAKEIDAIIAPFSSMPGQPVTITVTSRKGPFTAMPQAKLIFSNNLVFPLRLEGALPAATLFCSTNIPSTASPGPISISVVDENSRPIGSGQGMIGTAGPGAGGPRGEININIMPPHIMPGSNFEIQVHSPSSLYLLPKVNLDIPGKGIKELRLEGQVPGNSFRAQAMFPRDAKVRGSRIDLRFDRGTGEEIRSIFLEGGGEEERREFRPPKLTPYPPIPGQPLMLTLYAPEQVDFVPLVRVSYYNGQNESIPMSGPIPGDTFSGTLARVIMPLKTIDIFDPEDNELLISLPIEMFGGYGGGITPATPVLEVTPPQPLMPPVIANLIIKFPQPIPMIPRVNIQLPDGRNINVFVNGAIPGTYFNGMLQIPADCPSGSTGVQVYIGEQLIPGMPPIMIGGGTFTTGDVLDLKTFPNGPIGEINVDWMIMPNAMKHRLTYQAPGVAPKTIDLGRIGHYILTGLRTGIDYQIILTAYDQGGKEFARSERMIRVPETSGTMPGFPVYVHSTGTDSLQINWEPQFNAASYELHYALSPADPMTGQTRPIGNTTSYMLNGLTNGTYRIIIEAISATGERKKSQEIAGTVGSFNIGKPPVTLIPNPPVTGQPLEIQITTPMIIPVLPKLAVKYLTLGEEFVTLTGAVPGSSFAGRLASVKEGVAFINIFDPFTNELKYSYPVSTNFITPIMPGGGIINVNPDPPIIGQILNVSCTTDKLQPLQPYARFYFTDRPTEDKLMTGPLNGTIFNYTYPVLSTYLLRIEIWDNAKLTKIAERPFGPMTTMPGGFGNIEITNPPAITGKSVNIVLRNIQSQMNPPKLQIFFRGPIAPLLQQMNGPLPGTNFTLNTAPLPYDIDRIEAWDNAKINKLAPDFYVAAGPMPGTGSGGTLMVNPPCPRKGDTANVSASTNLLQPIQPYARFFFVDRPYQDMLMTGQAGGTAFNYTYANLPADVVRVELWDNYKTIKLAEFTPACGASTGNLKANISTTPDPPILSTYTAISVNIADMTNGQPANLSTYPQIYADFMNGRLPLPARGSLPGSTFNGEILAVNFTSQLQSITVEHNGLIIGQRTFGSTPAPGTGQLGFSCNNPYAGQEIRCITDIPLSQPALTERPEVRIFYPAGTSPLDELMTVNGNIPGWHFESVVSQARVRPDRAELKLTNGYRQTFYFAPTAPGTVPFDPPCPVNLGQPLSYCMTLPSPQPAPPYIRIYFKDNSPAPLEYLMTGSGTYFCVNTPNLTNYVERFELWDNGRANKLAEKFCGVMGTDCWSVMVTPDPPRISEPCSVTLTNPCGRQITMSAYLHVTFDNGTSKDYLMNGSLPGANFSFTIPANEMTRNVTAMDGWDNSRVKLPGPTRNWGAPGAPTGYGEIILTPPCPGRYASMNIEVKNLTSAQPSLPWVRVYYKDNYPMSENQMNGTLPGTNFNFYLSSISNTIDRVEIWDNPRTYKLADIKPPCAAGCPDQYALTLEIRPMPYNVGQSTTLAFDLPLSQPYISTRPTAKVYYNTQGSETVNLSSGVVPGWHFEGSFIPKENFSSIEIDIPNCWMKNFPATIYQNTDYPTNLWDESTGDAYSRKIHWNTVGGATGYDIYCGLSNPPSIKWKEVIGGSIASEIITGLTIGQTYYYTVKVRGGERFERVNSFVAGTGSSTGGTGKIKIISPPLSPDGAVECSLPDTNPGYTSGSVNITIQNIGTSNITLKKRGGLLVKMIDPSKTIPAASVIFPDSLVISAGSTITQAISINIPSGTASGDYTNRGPGAELLTLFDDVNNNGNYESAEESGVTVALSLYVGTWVAGIDTQEPGVDFGSVTSGSTSTLKTIHISNTISSALTNIKTISPMLGMMGGGSYISPSNITFNLNSTVNAVLGPGETASSTIRVAVPTGTISGTYGGMFTIYNDTDNDSSVDEGVEPYETFGIMILVTSSGGGSTVDHFTLSTIPSGISTSPVGKPVLIKVTAYSSTDNTTIATSFSSSVAMNVSGSNYILSLQDRVTKGISQLQISNGIGYCTIDATSAASLGISVSGYTSNTLSINFTTPTCSDLTVKQLAVDFERETSVGGYSAIQVFAVTDYGKVATNYTNTINFTFVDSGTPSLTLEKTSGSGTLSASPPYTYNFVTGDNGKASFRLKDTEAEIIQFNIIDTSNNLSASGSIQFTGVQTFIIEPSIATVQGNSIQLTAWAATNSGRKLNGYNGTATWQRISESGSTFNSSSATPSTLTFVNGNATFTLADTEYEIVNFRISDGSVNSADLSASFSSITDTTPPELTSQTTAETPFLIHLYFSEDIDSANARIKDNYNVGSGFGQNINKVCWYGRDVTLHLATPLPLGSNQNISVKAYSITVPYGIKDPNGNALVNISGEKTVSVTVPTVDYQSSAYGSGDWLEIQTAPNQVPVGNQSVKVMILQKNACGYLNGSNAVNRSTDVPNVSITYENPQYLVSPASSQTMSDGRCEFTVTTNFTASGQTVTITASAGGVTSGAATITSQ